MLVVDGLCTLLTVPRAALELLFGFFVNRAFVLGCIHLFNRESCKHNTCISKFEVFMGSFIFKKKKKTIWQRVTFL